ncbi:MAG: FAD:protein FMN transferase [Peptoniphilus sp. oral taxon 375]|nr:FAD:protein FMN transferase [Peptoniphilus sp. oral taxon 375]
MKKMILLLACLACLVACQPTKKDMYTAQYYDLFDTVTTLNIPAKNEEEAQELSEKIHDKFLNYHKLYDGYHTYPGLNNLKTINDQAGKNPVKVDDDLFDLIEESMARYHTKSKEVNIAMGSVLKIWSDYRDGFEAGADFQDQDPNQEHDQAQLPPMDQLQEAAKHSNIDDIILNPEEKTVFLKDPKMALDLGAVAKGYATEKIGQYIEEDLKIDSALISAGGNVRLVGQPIEKDRKTFVIGIQNPDVLSEDSQGSNVLDAIKTNDTSIVTSGDYQRYYIVEGKKYHHLIDPKTLMPGDYFRAVTVVTKDSGYADFLSTAVFLMPYEEGRKFVDGLDGVEAYWIMKDGQIHYTDGMDSLLTYHRKNIKEAE